jgi:hypothetical protein
MILSPRDCGALAQRGCKARKDRLCMTRSYSRVGLFGNAVQSGWYTPSKAKYNTRPIVNKYREGKLKRTLKREFNSA